MASGSEQREQMAALLNRTTAEVEEIYTTDGSLDFEGNPALKHCTGGWRACRSILGTEFCYCVAMYGIKYNLVTYLTAVLGQSNVAAATSVSTWDATTSLTPLAGAILADSYWGRYRTMVICCSVGVAGMLMTALSAYLPLLIKYGMSDLVSTQESILFLGLYMIAIGSGGLRPCLMSFGADQFDGGDPSECTEKGTFFNWYLLTVNCASLVSGIGIVWVQDHYGWALGLTVPAVVLAVGLSCLVAALRAYRFQRTRGSPLTRVCQVVVAAVRKFGVEPPSDSSLLYEMPEDDASMKGVQRIEHTTDLRSRFSSACILACLIDSYSRRIIDSIRFFDKAAIVALSNKEVEEAAVQAAHNPWRLCGVTQVEELKILVRMLPLWATIAFFYAVSAQVSSTFVEQGMAMDGAVGTVRVPPASMSTFDVITVVVLVPLYVRAFVPVARRLTGKEKGISELQRIGIGLVMPVLAMAAAAILETVRLRAAKVPPLRPTKISLLWQAPQYSLVGVGEMLTTIEQLDFFYSQAPVAMKTVCTALGLVAMAAGGYLNSFLLTVVQWATTTGGRPGWIPDDLNEGHLDRFFWMMAGLGFLNLMAYLSCALRYKSRKA